MLKYGHHPVLFAWIVKKILICCIQSVIISAPVRSAVRRGGGTGAAAAGSASPAAGGTPTAPSDRFVCPEMANLFKHSDLQTYIVHNIDNKTHNHVQILFSQIYLL